MALTIAEKIMSRQNTAGVPVKAGDLIDARIDGVMARQWSSVHARYQKMGFRDGPPVVWDADKIYVILEHNQPPADEAPARGNYVTRKDVARLGLKHFHDSELGIGQQIMMDNGYARPGELVVGNDSHTIAIGALNAAATGIGYDELAYAIAFGELFFTVPETIKVTLRGRNRPYPFAKDIVLWLAGQYGDAFAQNYALEFDGPLASDMDLASRMTLADHAVEVGAKFGIFLADEKTHEYMRARTQRPYQSVEPDAGATYARRIEVDCDSIGFQIAKPYRFDNVSPVTDVTGVKIDQARIGSCANGRFEDIAIAAKMLKGRKVAPGVRFYVSPSSMEVYRRCAQEGLVATLLEAGVQVINPGCSICDKLVVLNEEVCISSTTRNYRGRMGGASCSEAQIYLAGPATVTAAAIAGRIVDPGELLDARHT